MRRSSRVLTSVLAGLAVAGVSSLASAQTTPNSKIEPPTVSGKSDEGQGWGIFMLVVLMLVVVGATMLPTKRSHQD